MRVPDFAHHRIKSALWEIADRENWPALSNPQKSALFEQWIRDERVGGILGRYLDTGNIRVYIKDTIMKPYSRERIKAFRPIREVLGLPEGAAVEESYIKPHGRRMSDGRVICWGLSRDWKSILLAVFERAYIEAAGVPFAAVVLFPSGKCQQPVYRQMVELAAVKLGIERLEWYDSW